MFQLPISMASGLSPVGVATGLVEVWLSRLADTAPRRHTPRDALHYDPMPVDACLDGCSVATCRVVSILDELGGRLTRRQGLMVQRFPIGHELVVGLTPYDTDAVAERPAAAVNGDARAVDAPDVRPLRRDHGGDA